MKKFIFCPIAAILLQWSGAALSADYVAIRIEAENFTAKSDRWVLISDDTTPVDLPDPDPAHHGNASGTANLELLPDLRVTHADDSVHGGENGTFWGGNGEGPRIDYNVDIPEPGRYLVYVKTFSTGTEDNGIHVGINGTSPTSGEKVQICSKNAWVWTSKQRTDENHCGVDKQIWLDVPVAGVNTITFYAREDGFEIDQFLLLKETHDGSQDCFPTSGDRIRCRDIASGSTLNETAIAISQTIDGNIITSTPTEAVVNIDLELDIDVAGNNQFINSDIEYTVTVTNNDNTNSSSDTEVKIDLPSSLEFTGSNECSASASIVRCDIGHLTAGNSAVVSFTAATAIEGEYRVDAQVSGDETDLKSNNNTDSTTVSTSEQIPDFDAKVTMLQSRNVSAIDNSNQYSVIIENIGLQDISDASISFDTDDAVAVTHSLVCSPECSIPSIAPGDSTSLTFNTRANQSGVYSVGVAVQLTDDANPQNNNFSITETIVDAPIALANAGQIVIEAEHFQSISTAATENAPEWNLIDGSFTALDSSLDPDQSAPENASNNSYVELLPDTRIDENSPATEGQSNFSSGGVGATLSYEVFFPTAGDYAVNARIRSNNTQDASVYVGLGNDWQISPLSVCNPDGSWQWVNSTRDANGCSNASAMILSVVTPGMHTLMISQETDGLELDKLVLSLNLALALESFGPEITAATGSGQPDLSLSADFSTQKAKANEPVDYRVSVVNNSLTDDAHGILVTIDGLQSVSLLQQDFDSCAQQANGVVCALNTLSAGETAVANFALTSDAPLTVTADVTSGTNDNNSFNNTANTQLSLAGSSSGGGALSLWFLLLLLAPAGVKTRNRK